MLEDRAKKASLKKAKRPFYGPADKNATKIAVGIVAYEGAGPESMRRWYSQADARNDPKLLEEVLDFIRNHEAKSGGMMDRIIGCPREEGIDYPEGGLCRSCP